MRRRHSDGDLEKMRESWHEWPRRGRTPRTTALKSSMKSEICGIIVPSPSIPQIEKRERVVCRRCGVPLTPSKGSPKTSKAEVEGKTKRRNAVVSWQREEHPPLSLVQCFVVSRGCQGRDSILPKKPFKKLE